MECVSSEKIAKFRAELSGGFLRSQVRCQEV
jgi:hypothetical protein